VSLHAGSAALRFEVAVNDVMVQLAPQRQPGQPVPVTRIDDTHWNVGLPASLAADAQVRASVRGGSAATRDAWDAFYVATVDAPATPRASIGRLSAKGRRITASIGGDTVRSAAFVAYVRLDGRRVSTRASGSLTAGRHLVLTLRRAVWRQARRRGRLVVRVTTPSGVHVQRLRLPR
jgi:hypothetical protein